MSVRMPPPCYQPPSGAVPPPAVLPHAQLRVNAKATHVSGPCGERMCICVYASLSASNTQHLRYVHKSPPPRILLAHTTNLTPASPLFTLTCILTPPSPAPHQHLTSTLIPPSHSQAERGRCQPDTPTSSVAHLLVVYTVECLHQLNNLQTQCTNYIRHWYLKHEA